MTRAELPPVARNRQGEGARVQGRAATWLAAGSRRLAVGVCGWNGAEFSAITRTAPGAAFRIEAARARTAKRLEPA